MEVFRPQNVNADLSSVSIDLQIQSGCLSELLTISVQSNQVFLRPGTMSLLKNMRHFGDGELPQDVYSRRTTVVIKVSTFQFKNFVLLGHLSGVNKHTKDTDSLPRPLALG